MFGNDAENEFRDLLDGVSPAERAEVVRAIGAIADHFAAAAAGVECLIADCNPDLAVQSWDAAQCVIQAAMKGRGDRR